MEDTQDLIFEIEGNVGSVGSSDLLGVVSLVMTGGTEALHLGKTSDSFEQQTGKKAKTVSRSLARTTTNIWETGNKKILRQVYSNHLPVERPTPKNFIIRLAGRSPAIISLPNSFPLPRVSEHLSEARSDTGMGREDSPWQSQSCYKQLHCSEPRLPYLQTASSSGSLQRVSHCVPHGY